MGKRLTRAQTLLEENQPSGEYCLLWTGARTNAGYGNVQYEGKTWKAHRLGFHLNNPQVSIDGLVISHICHNSLCVRASHLEAVTQSENITYSWRKGRRGGVNRY